MIAWIASIARIACIPHMYACIPHMYACMSRLGYPRIRCPSYVAAHVMLCGGSCDMHAYAYRLSSHAIGLLSSCMHASMYAREQERASASGQCPPCASCLTRKRLLRVLTCVCSRDRLPRALSGCSSLVPWPLSFAVASHLLSPLICCGLSSALVCHVLWRVSSAVVSHVPSCGARHDLSCVMSSVMLSATSSVISHLHLPSVMLSHLSCIMSSIMLSAALHPAPLLPRLVVDVEAVPRSARSLPACLPAV